MRILTTLTKCTCQMSILRGITPKMIWQRNLSVTRKRQRTSRTVVLAPFIALQTLTAQSKRICAAFIRCAILGLTLMCGFMISRTRRERLGAYSDGATTDGYSKANRIFTNMTLKEGNERRKYETVHRNETYRGGKGVSRGRQGRYARGEQSTVRLQDRARLQGALCGRVRELQPGGGFRARI